MAKRRPDLTEKTRKSFVSEEHGKVRFVDSFEKKETWIDESIIDTRQDIDVKWQCQVCSTAVATFTELSGQLVGLSCGCASRLAKLILCDEVSQKSTHPTADVQKAILILRMKRKESVRGILSRLANIFTQLSR